MDESNLPVPANLKRLEWFTPRSHRILFPSEKFYSLQDKIPAQISQTSKQLSTFTETSLSYQEKPLGKTGCNMLNTLGFPKPELPAWATWKSPAFIHPRWWSRDFSINSVFQLLQFPDPKLCRHLMRTLSSIYLKHLPSWKCSKWKSADSTAYGLRCICRVPTCTYVYPSKTAQSNYMIIHSNLKKHVRQYLPLILETHYIST